MSKASTLARGELATIGEIIEEARNGRMFILVDDEDRENEGDLIIPGQMVTPDAIAFMAKHGRGLICLAMTKGRCDALGLAPMARSNGTRLETAFTVSIEAREGVSTGISASDRARTISVAVDAGKGASDLVSPGHVFPLAARKGGVLVRSGHTEAAVDIAELAGLNPSGVICEIMKDDGTMARMDDLVPFARKHGLKIGTIRDLIAYRLRHDHLLERRAEIAFSSDWGGDWTAVSFWNRVTDSEQVALVKGEIDPDKPTIVRMHAISQFNDIFGATQARGPLLRRSMEYIGEAGAGIVVIINRQYSDALSHEIRARKTGPTKQDIEAFRDYGMGAMILAELGVGEMHLLTNRHHSLVGLAGYGLSVSRELPI